MAVRKALLRLAGYDPAIAVVHSRGDQQSIVHMGWTVGLGAAVAGVNWGVGGYAFTGGGSSAFALGAALIAGVVGFSVVAIVDRSIVYAMDTHCGRRAPLWALVASRIVLTCFVSSVTTEAIRPTLMKPELELQSLVMREESERNRSRELEARYDLSGLKRSALQTAADLQEAQSAAQVVPPEIQMPLNSARSCWREYTAERGRLLKEGTAETPARQQLAAIGSRCRQMDAGAQRLLQEYRDRTQTAVAAAEQKYRDASKAANDAAATVSSREAEATEIEHRAITPFNSVVSSQLMATDGSARRKFWSIFGLIMGLELLPLLSKLLLPQTGVGVGVGTDRIIAIAQHVRRRNASAERDEMEAAIRRSMGRTMQDAAERFEMGGFATQLFATKLKALIPMEVFKSVMHEVEARDFDIQSFNREHPSHAGTIAEAWEQLVDEMMELLKRSPAEPS